jgi:hypothetical protein
VTLEDRINKLMTNHPDLFPTEAKVWAYIRGALRRGLWEKSPLKFRAKAANITPPPPDYKGKARKGSICHLSGKWTGVSAAEVDHLEGHKSLLCEADIIPYIIHLLASDDELAYVDKEVHKIKSYADRMGITLEAAMIEKEAIRLQKEKKDIDFIKKAGYTPASNAKLRRSQLIEILSGGMPDGTK